MTDDKVLKADRMRYNKNKASANFALLAILFDVFFFVNIYKSNVGSYYYTAMMGVSIAYNLLFLLAAFLSSEELKTYNLRYAYFIGIIGILQFVRILIIPVRAHHSYVTIQKVEVLVMENAQFIKCVLYLGISGLSCFISSAIGIVRTKKLQAYLATLGEEKRRD